MSAIETLTDGGAMVVDWAIMRVMAVFGATTPAEQTASSLVLAVAMWTSTVITLGVSIVLAFVFTFTFVWGVWRIITEGPLAEPDGDGVSVRNGGTI